MPKTRQQKEEQLVDIQNKLDGSKGIVFAYYKGLTVKSVQDLRKKLKEQDSGMIIAKKTLLKKAFGASGLEVSDDALAGSIAFVYGVDEVLPAKVLNDFAKKHKDEIKIVGGMLEKVFIDEKKVKELATLPSKEQLYAQVVGTIKAPITGFVNVLRGNLSGLVTVLKAVGEKK